MAECDRPRGLAAADLPVAATGTDPGDCPAAGPTAGQLHLARRPPARAPGRSAFFGEWWKRDAELAAVRDYFRVEDEAGERYWIFRSGDGEDSATGPLRWFLHGVLG